MSGLLAAVDQLCAAIGAVGDIPPAIAALAALIARARREGRDVAPAEIAALQLDADQTRAALAAAIDKPE